VSTGAHPAPCTAGAVSAGAILVVDDDPDLRQTLVEVLREEGYCAVAAEHGLEALERIEHERVALILLDMRMPVLNGWEFAEALRGGGVTAPIVVMTAAQDAARWASEVQAVDYLAKPFELPALLATVERWLGPPAGPT
jgi:CheY-like chemotaxis protein